MSTASPAPEQKARVQAFWEAGPCGAVHGEAPEGSPEFFANVERRRNELEPFIAGYADFAGSRGQRLLEIGVGVGTDFIRFARAGAICTGVDLTEHSVALVRRRLELEGLAGEVVQADAERLPFADGAFDFVYSRVALPWVHIPTALGELARITSAGGHIWCSLVSLATALAELRVALKQVSVGNVVFRSYVLANGALFHATGRQVRYPLRWTRCESFQTARGMARALHEVGFEEIRVETGKFFVITAKKPG
jgi:ubiquinone/menaquinone biosynthesis C-methylase UbiE